MVLMNLQFMKITALSVAGIELEVWNSELDSFIRNVFFIDVENADEYLGLILVCLVSLCLYRIHAFSRPPPVKRKMLPRRPALQILFKPDDIVATTQQQATAANTRRTNDTSTTVTDTLLHLSEGFMDENVSHLFDSTTSSNRSADASSFGNSNTLPSKQPKKPIISPQDLPETFAPLLSSSQMEIMYEELTTDLLHASQVEGSVRISEGRHEIPLDKDNTRPQLLLNVPKEGCKLNAVVMVGSDGLTTQDDLDVSKPTQERSLPMLKHASITINPPLPLLNVAPTLIHFPTLFEDNVVKYTLRRIQIVRYALDILKSISSFIEKVLWIIESKCQIHLGKVSITPLYKGPKKTGEKNHGLHNEPQWRLNLAFSGHVVLFGFIPIPFVNISLPTWIIPQPHALLQNLISSQPLASARVKREEIAEQQIILAILAAVESFDLNLEAVATPPAVCVDLALPGGITMAVETMHGKDVSGGRVRGGVENVVQGERAGLVESNLDSDSLSSCTLFSENEHRSRLRRNHRGNPSRAKSVLNSSTHTSRMFDSNKLVPWSFKVAMKGKMDTDNISVNFTNISAAHNPSAQSLILNDVPEPGSKISFSGNVLISRPDAAALDKGFKLSNLSRRSMSTTHLHSLALNSESRHVAAIVLYPEKPSVTTAKRQRNLLKYDYSFDVGEDTAIDAVSLSIGASHPMLKGGTIITTILESLYAYGSMSARDNSVLDTGELHRKRNILKHLPAIDVTAGIQNIFIPEESMSYSDDAQTKCIPELFGGQMMMRVTGGFDDLQMNVVDDSTTAASTNSSRKGNISRHDPPSAYVSEGIKVVLDFGVGSIVLNNQTKVSEFPELEIYGDQKLISTLAGSVDGTIGFHLRPQDIIDDDMPLSLSKNLLNPLEAYDIDFSGSNVEIKLTEANSTLGHRRLIIPSETTVGIHIVHSVVDMSFNGKTDCEFNWDFQGSSPTLQSVEVGLDPRRCNHEEKKSVNLLISALRQGRFNLNVSSVGGLTITQAVTSRANREGLYDWKFFNAIVSPDDQSAGHIMKVLHDKVTISKLLQVIELINKDLEKLLRYVMKQVWRAKEIFDAEGVSDPGHAIPGHKMARLLSMFLCGDASQVDDILPIVRRVVAGDGLDVMKTKELLQSNLSIYDDYAPEIDRVTRWAETMLGSVEAQKPFVEKLSPLALSPRYLPMFAHFPSARELYSTLLEKRHLPLDPSFSSIVGSLAPYMSLPQVEYILQVRAPGDWQAVDLRRLRYVYTVKKRVLDISESYGGLSFMPQSFFLSVFVGEATRASLRSWGRHRFQDKHILQRSPSMQTEKTGNSTLHALRKARRLHASNEKLNSSTENLAAEFAGSLSPAGRIASMTDIPESAKAKNIFRHSKKSTRSYRPRDTRSDSYEEVFDVGDSLLGPEDVAILLQAGLTSSMKGSTVVQLNQRMLLDLMASQPRLFSVAVLCEIGSPGGHGSPRGLTSALMALLDLDQCSFREFHRLDMHKLMESWLPGLAIPRREDYLAGGRWASQSYYDAIFGVAQSILEEAEVYNAFKSHIQRVRHDKETDPVPTAAESVLPSMSENAPLMMETDEGLIAPEGYTQLSSSICEAKSCIATADEEGFNACKNTIHLSPNPKNKKDCEIRERCIELYEKAFHACRNVLKLDKHAFHADWFKSFYRRNYDALMVKSVYENVKDDVDEVREWLSRLSRGPCSAGANDHTLKLLPFIGDKIEIDFMHPEKHKEQDIVDAIIRLLFYDKKEMEEIRADPLVRLLISNRPGDYDFSIITAMGVITEGKNGLELEPALKRLKETRGVDTIRADTGTARSLEYNATQIQDAIEEAVGLNKPYGLLGYSQGGPNSLLAESLLLSGSPAQQEKLSLPGSNLVCRQLLFSAANGSMHGPATEAKTHRLIVMCESFFKYQQGYCSRAFIKKTLEVLTNLMDSAAFQKFVAGGGGTFLHSGSRAFWREAQHLSHVPTCVMRGVLEENTTPECLEMISNLLTKVSGSHLHDSQVHVYDAVGRPVYTKNRNAKILEYCEMGGAIQRTHHWSPLKDEVKFVQTSKDIEHGVFLCASDRHVFPWVDVNARFGIIKYADDAAFGEQNDC